MIDLVALCEVFLDAFHDLRALADALILYLDVTTQGIEAGGDSPHVDIVKGLDSFQGLDIPDQFFQLDVFGDGFKQDRGRLLDHAICPFEDD